MSLQRRLGVLALLVAVPAFLAGCSHAIFPTNGGGGGGNSTSPMILTIHDSNAPTSGVTVTAFEATVTGASLTPASGTPVSLLSSSQTIEFTQLQTNSVYLSTTQVAVGNYTSLTITYANPQYTIFNGTGASLTINGQTCAAAAECVITGPTVDNVTGTVTFSSQIVVQQNNQTLIEVDVNLNDLIQSTFDVDFSKSIAATVTQGTNASAAIGDPLRVSGQVTAVSASSSQFTITPAIGPQLTITTTGTTAFEFTGANCTNNNFSCITTNQIVDVTFNVMGNGTTFGATEVDFDDTGTTQQISGQIVAMDATPPTTLTIVVHNTIPAATSLPNGSLATVTISTSTTDPATYVINNGALVLPSSPTLSFASTSDVIVGQEVEARVASGSSISNGAFTTDRLALEQTQLQATATSVNATAQPPQPSYVLSSASSTNPLPSLFVDNPLGSVTQIQVLTVTQGSPAVTLFQALSPNSMSGITSGTTVVSTGGFLFNTPSVGSPTIVATVVRGEVSGT